MLEEAAVFNGQHRMHQVLRDLVVGDEAALGAVGVFAEAGDQFGLELVAGQRLTAIVGNGIHLAILDLNGGAVLGVIGLRAGKDGDAVVARAVGAHGGIFLGTGEGVVRLAEFLGDQADGELLAGAHFARLGEDLGSVFEQGLLEALIDDVLVLDVVIAAHGEHGGGHRRDENERDAEGGSLV